LPRGILSVASSGHDGHVIPDQREPGGAAPLGGILGCAGARRLLVAESFEVGDRLEEGGAGAGLEHAREPVGVQVQERLHVPERFEQVPLCGVHRSSSVVLGLVLVAARALGAPASPATDGWWCSAHRRVMIGSV